MSGDKLLGGPQAGIILGDVATVAKLRKNPFTRAMRVDKLTLAALEATLRLYREPERAVREIPVLAMLAVDEAMLTARAERLAAAIGPPAAIVPAVAKVGGGALPLLELPGPAVAVSLPGVSADDLAARLRAADPPVVGRIEEGRLLLDPRTLADDEIGLVARALR
jgi:L-seryl-tRNA(Ser) seleniumtransferase